MSHSRPSSLDGVAMQCIRMADNRVTYFVAFLLCSSLLFYVPVDLIDWCFTARQHKIGQFVPIYHGGLLTGSGV